MRGTDQINTADDFTSTNTIRLPGKTLSVRWDKRREACVFKLALGKRAFENYLSVMDWK